MCAVGGVGDIPAGVEHVGHEGGGRSGPRRVDDVHNDGRERGRDRLEHDASRGAPVEHFDLTRRVHQKISAELSQIFGGKVYRTCMQFVASSVTI